jgi:cytochrome d ubiquinol oxidase subunit II
MLHLHTLWFIVVAFFWTGFFVLEGFDFGVGMLHAAVGRTNAERTAALETIGPFWDGNEVWLIVAGASMFAAFPGWYATAFSALYLALLLVLAALMARGVSFEYRDKLTDARWRGAWQWATIAGSALVPLLLGVGLGDLLKGLPINQDHNFTGNFFDLLTPYGLWTGATFLILSALHGAVFLTLKASGAIRDRAHAIARWLAWVAIAAVAGFMIWTRIVVGPGFSTPVIAIVILAVLATAYLIHSGQDGWAFATSAATIGMCVVSIFAGLYPNLIVSSTNHAYNLTVSNASSGGYALTVMTVVAVLILPIVLLYQAWSYHVFRARVRVEPPEPTATD